MGKARTGDQALVREINLSIILNALRDQSPTSRAALAVETGLNKTTVSSLVQQLIEAGFVSEIGPDKPEETGRPGILLALDPRAGRMIGAEIGVDFISVIVTNFAAALIWHRQEQTSLHEDQDVIIQATLRLIRQAIQETGSEGNEVLGLGLGVPGLVDVASGTLLFGPNLGWRDVPLRHILGTAFPFPVYVDNEANMATLGETFFGVARGARTVLYVSAGVGLGGGIVVEGHILTGATGFGGEVGHMTIIPDGRLCNCGNHGCWETLVSQAAVFARVREKVAGGAESRLLALTAGDLNRLTVPLVVTAAQAGDPVAQEALAETGNYLGIGLANLVNALNPEIVVFGGILSLAGAFLLPIVGEVIRARALRWSVEAMQVLVAAHGFDACAMGGIATVYQQIFSRPLQPGHAGTRVLAGAGAPRSTLS